MSGRLRISGGSLRGRYIRTQDSTDLRPTTERVREAVFSSLASREILSGAKVLDLYAGSGILGFEAISRGASDAVMVEQDLRRSKLISQNAGDLGLSEIVEVHRADVTTFVGNSLVSEYSLIFSDPPYAIADHLRLLGQLLETECLADRLTIVCEGPVEVDLSAFELAVTRSTRVLEEIWQRSYGTSVILGMTIIGQRQG